MKTRRVGSITCGALLIIFGILFMVHMFYPPLSLEFIMRLWPLILIALGMEMLLANIRNNQENEILKYDKGAIFLVILLACFSIIMGLTEYYMDLSYSINLSCPARCIYHF